jgi:hypothetical protein
VSFLFVLTFIGFIDYLSLVRAEGWLDISRKIQLSQVAGWTLVGLLMLAVASLWHEKGGFADRILDWIKRSAQSVVKYRWLALLAAGLLCAAYPLLIFSEANVYLNQPFTRLAVFSWLVVVQTTFIAIWNGKYWLEGLALSVVSLAVAYHFATYLPHISNYPFGLWWSEVSRFYLASTFFDTRIYGVDTPWVFRDTTRYLLQAIPFLVNSLPLWTHRLWQVLLRFSTPYITGWIFARRLELPKQTTGKVVFILWAGLFLFQGPVFYNLLVVMMLMLWLVDTRRFARTLLVVATVSVWAGLSRINWVPMPALIAIIFYLLETPYSGRGWRAFTGYLWQPATWAVAGVGAGLLTQNWYANNSGNIEGVAYSSFTSDLIWKRLFPNPSYPLGIILAVLLVAAPLLIYLGMAAFKGLKKGCHWLRVVGIFAIVVVLFLGGLLVSIKIGGGTNLHNMDVFLVAIWIVGVSLYYGRAVNQDGEQFFVQPPTWLLAVLVIAPMVFTALFGGRSIQPVNDQVIRQDLETLRSYVREAVSQGGEVLFVSQRHLITFGIIDEVPLVHEYEKMELMDNVMAGTPAYLDAFEGDMSSQRFALIIQDPLPVYWKNPEKDSLAEENNVYLKRAVPLILCAYQEETRLAHKTIQLMIPKLEPDCGQNQE